MSPFSTQSPSGTLRQPLLGALDVPRRTIRPLRPVSDPVQTRGASRGAWSPPIRAAILLSLFAMGLALIPGCETTMETAPYYGDGGVVTRSLPTRTWSVLVDGRQAGTVVRYEEEGSERFFLAVRNIHGQDLGMVDAKGRAWRNRPFEEALPVGSGTVLDGVRRILDLPASARLVETTVDGRKDVPPSGL